MVQEARVGGVLHAVDVPLVGHAEVVQIEPAAVAARYQAQAPIAAAGVLQVVHQEDHPRHFAVGTRVLPQHAVLVPVQARPAGRLADDDRLPELDVREAHAVQFVEGGGVADQVGQFGVAVGVDQRAGRPGARQALFVLRGDGPFGAGAGVLDERRRRHVGDDAETVFLQLPETLRGDGVRRRQGRRGVGGGHALHASAGWAARQRAPAGRRRRPGAGPPYW